MPQADIGLIGLAVMGQNLVLNMSDHDFHVAVYNRSTDKVDSFVNGSDKRKNITGCHSIKALVASLRTPRRVMLMVRAGDAVEREDQGPGLGRIRDTLVERRFSLILLGELALVGLLLVTVGV